jgi:hypothetical protein
VSYPARGTARTGIDLTESFVRGDRRSSESRPDAYALLSRKPYWCKEAAA